MPVYEMPGMLIFALYGLISTILLLKEIIILIVFVRRHKVAPAWWRMGLAILSIPVIMVALVLAAQLLADSIPLSNYAFIALSGLLFWGLVSLAAWRILHLTKRQGVLLFGWMAGFGVLATAVVHCINILMMPDNGFLLATR